MSTMTLERKGDTLWLTVSNGTQSGSFNIGHGIRADGSEALAVQLLRAAIETRALDKCDACDDTGRIEATDGSVWESCYKCGRQAQEKAEPVAIEQAADDLQAVIDGERPRWNKSEMCEHIALLRSLTRR